MVFQRFLRDYRTLVLSVFGLLLVACSEPKPKPELQLQDVSGQAVSLQALANKPTVVNVWATWCAPCRREMPLLQQSQQTHSGVQFVFVNQGEKPAAIESFLRKNNLTLQHVWLDPQFTARKILGYQGLPTTYFLNAHGEVVGQSVGELDDVQLQQWLQKIQ